MKTCPTCGALLAIRLVDAIADPREKEICPAYRNPDKVSKNG